MKRKATPSKQAAKRAKKEKPFEPAAVLNNPIGDYLHCDPPVGTSASIVCFGSNVQNKFFTASSTYLKDYTTKTTNNLNSPIQLNFFERGTQNAVRKVYAGYDNSFLLTEEGKCFVVGTSHNTIGLRKQCALKPSQVMSNHTIVGIATSKERTVFVTGAGRVFACGQNRVRDGSLGIHAGTFPEPIELTDDNSPRFKTAHIGTTHTVLVTFFDELYGMGEKFPLGLGAQIFNNKFPTAYETSITPLSLTEKIKTVACGDLYTAVLSRDGNLWATGGATLLPRTIKTLGEWHLIEQNVTNLCGGNLFYVYQKQGQFQYEGTLGSFTHFDDIKYVFTGLDYVIGISHSRAMRVVGHNGHRIVKFGNIHLGPVIEQHDVDFEVMCGSSHCMAVACTLLFVNCAHYLDFGKKGLVYSRLRKSLQRQEFIDISIVTLR